MTIFVKKKAMKKIEAYARQNGEREVGGLILGTKDDEGNITVKDAKGLWGKGAIRTQRMIKDIHGENTQVLCMGPAGENLVRSATIQHNLANASGGARTRARQSDP